MLREHLVALAAGAEVLAGLDEQAFIGIDSLPRPVYGHAKQGASYGHTKITGKQVLRKGLSPLATTISTERHALVLAGMRLRAGKTGSGKGAGRMVACEVAEAGLRLRPPTIGGVHALSMITEVSATPALPDLHRLLGWPQC